MPNVSDDTLNRAALILDGLADTLDHLTGTWADHAQHNAAEIRTLLTDLLGGRPVDRAYAGTEWRDTLCIYVEKGRIDYERLTDGRIHNTEPDRFG